MLFFKNIKVSFASFHQNSNLQKPSLGIIFSQTELQLTCGWKIRCRLAKNCQIVNNMHMKINFQLFQAKFFPILLTKPHFFGFWIFTMKLPYYKVLGNFHSNCALVRSWNQLWYYKKWHFSPCNKQIKNYVVCLHTLYIGTTYFKSRKLSWKFLTKRSACFECLLYPPRRV